MDLYDDLDTKQRGNQIDGWSSGIKLLQTQLALKKVNVPPGGKKEPIKRPPVNTLIVYSEFISAHTEHADFDDRLLLKSIDASASYAIEIKTYK